MAPIDDSGRPPFDLYCTGCNERFAAPSVQADCPRCGAAAQSHLDVCSETLLLHEDLINSRTDTICEVDDGPECEEDSLVGREIHVYRCDSLLGRGGMGRVYLARHLDLHRRCALKILAPHLAQQDRDYVERFQHEGRAAAELVHPNIVTIHAIGQADDRHFLEMEFVSGPSLQQLLQQDGPQTPIRATALVTQIAFGLAFAHRAGIVHRDLKPDNVMLTARGVPKIADFGLAKRIVADSTEAQRQLVGTPNFMAPELFRGQDASTASDVYALGVCYYVLLTGRYPFVGRNITDLMRVAATEDVPDVRRHNPEVTLEMAECLSLMLSKSTGNRPADGMAAWSLLQAVLGQARDIDSLLVDAFADDPRVRWTRQDRRFTVELTLDANRRQRVFVETSDHRAQDRLLHIYSVCCRACDSYYEEALRLNSEIPHGSIAIRDLNGEPQFVMIDTYPRSTVDAEELRRSVLEVANRADTIERLLTGLDLH